MYSRVFGVAALAVLLEAGPWVGTVLADQVPHRQEARDTATAAADSTRTGNASGTTRVDYVLEPIVVVAPRERSTPPPVATITVEPREIHTTVGQNAYDLVRRVAGLEVHDQGQGPGFASNVVLRGFTADHSSDLLLVVDGVPLNLPVHGHVEGYADWSYLFPGAISSLRVIAGPSSPLYGDFSIAGTMEVFTSADADGLAGQLSGNGYGDASGWMTVGSRGDRGGALAGLELRRTEGWRDNSRIESGNALLRGWRGVGEGRLEGGLAAYAADWESPGFLSLADFAAGDLERAANGTDGGRQERVVGHARYAAPFGDGRYLQVIGWGVLSDWDLALTVPGHADALGNLYQTAEADTRSAFGGQTEASWLSDAGELTLGVSGRMDWSEYDLGRSLRRVPVEPLVALDAHHRSVSGYARWRMTVLRRVGLDLGMRVDYLRHRSYNRLAPDPDASVLEALSTPPSLIDPGEVRPDFHIIGGGGPFGQWIGASQTLVSPKLGVRVDVGGRWSIMASTSRGFRSAVGIVGDPARPSVTAWANELGVDFQGSTFTMHASLFRMDVSNERIQDPITLEIASSGSSVRQGLEAMASVGVGRGVVLFARGTLTDAVLSGRYADAHDDHNQTGTGTAAPASPSQDVPGIADYLGQLALQAPLGDALSGRIEWRVTGPYVPIGEPDVRTDPYATLDTSLSYSLGDRTRVDLEMRNVLDRVYAETRSSGYVSPGLPRTLSVTLQLMESPR
jgi:outer membrane receptor protein involved in Fe transport